MPGPIVREPSGAPGFAWRPRPGRTGRLPVGPGGREKQLHQHLRIDVSPDEHVSVPLDDRSEPGIRAGASRELVRRPPSGCREPPPASLRRRPDRAFERYARARGKNVTNGRMAGLSHIQIEITNKNHYRYRLRTGSTEVGINRRSGEALQPAAPSRTETPSAGRIPMAARRPRNTRLAEHDPPLPRPGKSLAGSAARPAAAAGDDVPCCKQE